MSFDFFKAFFESFFKSTKTVADSDEKLSTEIEASLFIEARAFREEVDWMSLTKS